MLGTSCCHVSFGSLHKFMVVLQNHIVAVCSLKKLSAGKNRMDGLPPPPPAQTPDQVANLVACKCCGLVKTYKQFYEHGCDNCTFLQIRQDRNRTDECTTASFNGIISTMDPGKSWAAKWCHIGDQAPGVYCLSVDEDLPYDIKDELEVQGVPHRVRSDPFYPAMD